MSGTLWAVLAGVGFGLFQASNRRASRHLDVYLSTFLQILVGSVVLVVIAAATGDLALLRTAPLAALIQFSLAAFVHFFLGWTLLNESQKRIGAARTRPLTSTVPFFGVVVAALAFREFPGPVALAGIALVVIGVSYVSGERGVVPEAAGGDGVSVPVTILLSPIAVGRHIECVTPRLWMGASVIIGGSLLLILYG